MAEAAHGRPLMPAGYGIKGPAEGSGLLPWEHVDVRLKESRNYWIVTTRKDGRPHAMPVWGVWLDGTIYFSTDPQSVKGRNLAARPDLVVHLESGDDAVIVEGRAQRISESALLHRIADVYEAKYQIRVDVEDPAFLFLGVRPRVVLAWLESDFPGGATRWVLEE